jgi:uncharacterized repeat protein (TIGR01451 family)
VTVVVTPQSSGTLVSTGTASSAHPDPNTGDNQATAQSFVTNTVEADLALTIDDGRGLVRPGDVLDYRIDVTNLGPWPVPGVTLTLTLSPALLNPSYVPSSGVYDPVTGAWSGLDLGAGQVATLVLTATVGGSAVGPIPVAASVAPPPGVNDLVPGNNGASDVNLVAAGVTELVHGTSARMRPDAAGERYFAIRQQPRSSYEVVVDEVSGDLGAGSAPLLLQRLGSALTVVGESVPAGTGFARSLRWQNATSAARDGDAIRVRSAGCTTDCGPDDLFRVRSYDTTYDLARFNNGSGQGTVLFVQNTDRSPASGTAWFWSPGGQLLGSASFTNLAPGGVYVLSTPSVAGVTGVSGSITVTNDAPYGALAGKAVSVEPATGFAFDTPMRPRPR